MKRIIAFLVIVCAVLSFTVISVGAYYDYLDQQYYGYDDYSEDYYDEYEDDEDYPKSFNIGRSLLIAFIVGLVISLIITGIMRSKMKSVRYERAASNYIKQGSMNVLRSRDIYLYSTVTKIPKPQNNNKR